MIAGESAAADALLESCVRELLGIPAEVAIADLAEPLRTYARYALQTVDRGRWALAGLPPDALEPGFRFLDAGCAYGGYLAAAAEMGAREVVGVDVDPRYLAIARRLLAARGVSAQVVEGSVGDERLLRSLGSFDVITCADVIEHVDSPLVTLGAIARALAPGGALFVAVPNAWCPACVRSDPHFQQFGITLLPREQARTYYRQVSGSTYYDVGEYHRLDDYLGVLRREGLTAALVNGPADVSLAASQLSEAARGLVTEAAEFQPLRLAPELVKEVRRLVAELASTIDAAVAGARRGRRWFRRRHSLRAVVDDYAVPTWNIVARRPRA